MRYRNEQLNKLIKRLNKQWFRRFFFTNYTIKVKYVERLLIKFIIIYYILIEKNLVLDSKEIRMKDLSKYFFPSFAS